MTKKQKRKREKKIRHNPKPSTSNGSVVDVIVDDEFVLKIQIEKK